MNKELKLVVKGMLGLFITTSVAMISSAQPPVAAKQEVAATTMEKTTPNLFYRYQGDRYRDPFIPLIGETRSDLYDRPPQVASLVLKGIVQDDRGRLALLTSGLASYIIKGGRLYDGRNKVVKGISGVVKAHSVILVGSDRSVRELQVSTPL